ncbi:putative receptor-like protein kinase [Forsythia ovata]|uniref:Receptor-like protein kinase n=1 Tax=Forsythia ovata TaxID=205694 RepID=A0ABD1NZC2_9LAMI
MEFSRLCAKLRLEEADKPVLSVDNGPYLGGLARMDLCLIGKILGSRPVNKDSLEGERGGGLGGLQIIWRTESNRGPEWIQNQASTLLHLRNNFSHGRIPVSIGKLFRLETLILATNNIQGNIPSSLSDCSSLRVIDLSENMLEGTIPSKLGNLTKLEDLTFAKNNLTGYIPLSFANLSSLNNLILMYNKFEGPIPSELGNLNLLLQINIGINNFSGQFPSSIFNLSSLVILGVVKNRFYGHLPSDLFTTLPNLMELYVGDNLYQETVHLLKNLDRLISP